MLRIVVPARELWDERNEEFIYLREHTLQLEHSLVSISKWEAKYCKPFLSKDDKTDEEMLYYIQCMTLTQNVNPDVYRYLTVENIRQVQEYIQAPMTATTFSDQPNGKGQRIVTSELIYYWMIAQNIPMECQKWHLNRLLTLIHVCSNKNTPPKKMSKKEVLRQYSDVNDARRRKLHTKG